MNQRIDAAVRWLAWKLPHRLVMWCGYRILANATTGQWGSQDVSSLSALTAMDRWGEHAPRA